MGQSFFTEKAPKCHNEKQILFDGFHSASFKGCKYQRLFSVNSNAIFISHSGEVLGHRWQSGRTDPCLQVTTECTRSWGTAGSAVCSPTRRDCGAAGSTRCFSTRPSFSCSVPRAGTGNTEGFLSPQDQAALSVHTFFTRNPA